jgi:hypothetical protein
MLPLCAMTTIALYLLTHLRYNHLRSVSAAMSTFGQSRTAQLHLKVYGHLIQHMSPHFHSHQAQAAVGSSLLVELTGVFCYGARLKKKHAGT